MTRPIADLDVPPTVLTLQVAATHTMSASTRAAYAIDEWLITHPNAPVSTDFDYPAWAAALATQSTYFRPLEAS
jgi:hypothetical protein